MSDVEDWLGRVKPRTALLATELLRIVLTILVHREEDPDPRATLSTGPVLEIIRNVIESLQQLDHETRLLPDCRLTAVETEAPAEKAVRA